MFRSNTIITQVVCKLTIVLIVVTLLFYSVRTLHFYLVSGIFTDAQQVLFKKQTANELRNYQRGWQRSTEQLIARNINKAEQFQLLYTLLEEHPEFTVLRPQQCLTKYQDHYESIASYCYGIFGKQSIEMPIETQRLIDLTGLLTSLLPMQNQDSDGQIAGLTEEQLFSAWPADILPRFQPNSRPWFIHHKQEVEKSETPNIATFCTPYQHYLYKYTIITETISLLGKENSWDGILMVTLNFTQIFDNSPTHISNSFGMVVDQSGKILLSQIYSEPLMINQQNITGLNQTDSDLIIQLANGKIIGQDENICKFSIANILCLYNKTTNEPLLVTSSYIQSTNFILVIVVKPIQQQNEVNEQQIYIEAQLQELIIRAIQNQIWILAFGIVVAFGMLYFIHRPLIQLHEFTCHQMYKSQLSMRQQTIDVIKLTKGNNTTINNLKAAFLKLSSYVTLKVSKKSNYCLEVEGYPYSVNYKKLQLPTEPDQLNDANLTDPVMFTNYFVKMELNQFVARNYESNVLKLKL